MPPSFLLEDECHRNFAFTMYHAEQLPQVEITDVEAVSLGGGLWRVVAGGTIADRFTAPLSFVENQPQRIWLNNGLAGESHQTFQWFLTGSGEATIRFVSARATDAAVKITLK